MGERNAGNRANTNQITNYMTLETLDVKIYNLQKKFRAEKDKVKKSKLRDKLDGLMAERIKLENGK